MSDEDTEQVMQTASDCLEGECSLDEVSELLSVLKDAEKDLEGRLDKIMNMVSQLQHLNEKDARETNEVRAFVKDLLRVFNTDVSGFWAAIAWGRVDRANTNFVVAVHRNQKSSPWDSQVTLEVAPVLPTRSLLPRNGLPVERTRLRSKERNSASPSAIPIPLTPHAPTSPPYLKTSHAYKQACYAEIPFLAF